ncbi:hypothetical protein ACP4OV_031864 [Aristida adscensionis]
MGEAPCIVAPRRAAVQFRLPRHGRRKVHVVRLGGGGGGGGGARAPGRGLRLRRLLRRAARRLAELCAAALSPGHPTSGGHSAAAPWAGVEPYFAAPFVPLALMKRAGVQD